ncbi:MAG: hypothetical protein PVI86_11640 [Phycisphaerae bacterium]|jgi:hypothetical protein
MQPGNNYRAGASTNLPAVLSTSQPEADANAPSIDVRFSEMLTVWRKLYVEVDSMASEPTTVEGRGPDWDRFDPIEVSGGEATTLFDGVGDAAGGPFAVAVDPSK